MENLESTLWTVEHTTGDVEITKPYESPTTRTEGDADLTIRLAGEVGQAKIIDDEEIEHWLCALVKDGEDEKYATEEREARGDLKRVEERLEVKTLMDVPGTQWEKVGPVKEAGVHASSMHTTLDYVQELKEWFLYISYTNIRDNVVSSDGRLGRLNISPMVG
ncbi:hypothetical protein BDM02DRAFT_3273609 [Thelephora ganbajun]|uniref:Uncharacterized protein n=1 Tax=Thelephora ganbajun TaxID=370292 RepID=A0ACB6YXV5_THEGA|nr:hypothetical protein BDM02DRAFT_3273609 [Thelephora ganbajun]